MFLLKAIIDSTILIIIYTHIGISPNNAFSSKEYAIPIEFFAFVAIPLPLTGVWTGACIALFIGLSKRDSMTSVILGNLVAGIIMMILPILLIYILLQKSFIEGVERSGIVG